MFLITVDYNSELMTLPFTQNHTMLSFRGKIIFSLDLFVILDLFGVSWSFYNFLHS
jgi:hypothetical protein